MKSVFIKRIFAALIDLYFLGFLLNIPFYFIWKDALIKQKDVFLITKIFLFCSLAIILLYWYILEKYYHTTLGKKLLKLQVVGNEKSNFFIRSVFKFVPLDIISFLFTKNGKFWHDTFSHTEVVEKK